MFVREVVQSFSVPNCSLQVRLQTVKSGSDVKLKSELGRFENTFSEEMEARSERLDNRFMPLLRKEFLKLLYDLAEEMGLSHRLNDENKSSGRNVCYQFMNRHRQLSM
jgi:hypothetical protein